MRVPFDVSLASPYSKVFLDGRTPFYSSRPGAFRCVETVVGVRRKKPVGWREPTAYSFTRTYYQKAQGTLRFTNAFENSIRSGAVGSYDWNSLNAFDSAYTVTPFPTSVDNTALIKARNALQGGKVNYGQAIAEHNQTARLVGNTCTRLLKAIRATRRGDVKGAAKALSVHKDPPKKFVKKIRRTFKSFKLPKQRKYETEKEARRLDKSIRNMKNVTGAWLELQYGWKPLLSDIEGSIDNLQSFSRFSWIYTAKATAKQNVQVDKAAEATYYSAYAAGYCSVAGSYICKYILIGIPAQSPASIVADTGLGNLPLIGWELIPFSFVVDWVLPVGNWLDSLDSTLGYDELRTVKVRFIRIKWKEVGSMQSPFKVGVTGSVFNGHKDYISHVRTVTSGVPYAGRPSIKDPSSFTHMANSLALLVQIFGKGSSSIK